MKALPGNHVLLLVALPSFAGSFTARPARWETSHVYCSAYSGTGWTTRTELESGAQPSMKLTNPISGESVAMGTTEGWESAFGVAHPDGATGAVAGLYAFDLSPMDRNNDRGQPSSQLALELHTQVVGPKMHLDTKGEFVGLWQWNPEEKIQKQLPHVTRAMVDPAMPAAWAQAVRQVWAPSVAETALRDLWATLGGAWIGKKVGGEPWETRLSPIVGVDLVRTWSDASSTGCGEGVKSCVALTVESRLADPDAATAVITAGQVVPPNIKAHVWSRQVTQVDPGGMQVHAWSQVNFQGQRDVGTDRVEGTATSVHCRPR